MVAMSFPVSFPAGFHCSDLTVTEQSELARGITESASGSKPWKTLISQEPLLGFHHIPETKHLGVEM